MKVDGKDLAKAEELLREALGRAKGDETIRAVLLLRGDSKQARDRLAKEPEPGQFRSRAAYRKAKMAQQRKVIDDEVGETVQALRELSLAPRGGKMSRAVVVEGPARQISTALGLRGVGHASLDRPIRLIDPRKRKGRRPKKQ